MSAFNLVCIALILQNALEFLSAFIYGSNPALALYFVNGVMFSLYFFAATLVYFSVTVAQTHYANLVAGLFGCLALLVAALHLGGLLISGFTPLSYTIISVPGPMYWVLQVYIFGVVLTTLVTLSSVAFSASPETQERCQTTLFAVTPICALGIGVIVLRALGYNASTAIAMPLASTIFVWVLMLDQRGEFITFKVKWRINFKLALNMKNLKLADWAEELEKQLFIEAMHAARNNNSAAARLLGCNQTTFHRKAEKHFDKPSTSKPSRRAAQALDSDYDYQ